MVAPLLQLEDSVAAYFSLDELPAVDLWAERTIYLPFGEVRDYVDFDRTPWAREPINSLRDPEVKVEAGIYASQLAKTTQAITVAFATIALSRQSLVWMWPKTDAARTFSQSKFKPIVEASPVLRALKPADHDLFKNLELHFQTGIVSFVGSHSRVDQKQRSVPVVIVDEIEDIAAATEKETDPITSIMERTKTFTDKKIFLFGSCLLESGPAWQQYLLGDQRHFLVPCPHCGTRQALEFRGPVWLINPDTNELELRGRGGDFNLWWDPAARIDDHNWDFDSVLRTARYHCKHCGGHIRDEHKRAMNIAGQWHPTVRAKISRQRSRRISCLHPTWPNTSFGNFALEFIGSLTSASKLQNFTNNWEAKPYSIGLDVDDKAALDERLTFLFGAHFKGERAGASVGLFADVQRHHIVYAFFGYDAAGSVHLIDFGYTRDFDSLRELDDKHEPEFVAVDSRYRTQEVYEAVHTRRTRWLAIRGEEKGAPLSPNYNFDPFTGDRGGRQGLYVITLVHLNTDLWGEEILARLHAPKTDVANFPGANAMPSNGEPAARDREAGAPRIRDFFVPKDFAKFMDFVRQLFAEYIIEFIDAKGRKKRQWKRGRNNHLFDLLKYAFGVGSMKHLTRIAIESAKAVAAAQPPPQPELDLTQPRGGTKVFN